MSFHGFKSNSDDEDLWLQVWSYTDDEHLLVTIFDDANDDGGYSMVLDRDDAANLRDKLLRWLGWPEDDA